MTGQPEPRLQAIPLDRAILWNPAGEKPRHSGRAPYPVFFHQEAVVALQDHLKASPQQAVFGFLVGGVFRDPEAGVLYAVIDKTLRLNQAIYGDKTEVVVARLWGRMQEQLARASGRLLGWYHSHPGQALTLSPHDVETHGKYFTDPWHVAVVVAAEADGVHGGFFRAGSSAAWAETPLPFYELLQPDSIRADGKKRSFIVWKNYRAYNPVAARPSTVDELPIIKSAADDEPPPARARPAEPPRSPAPVPLPPAPPPQARPAAGAREPRRTPAPSFKLLDHKAAPPHAPAHRPAHRSRRGRWVLRLLVLLLVAGVGGGAAGYWYVYLREPGAPLPFGLGRWVGASGGARTPPPPTASSRPRARADPAFARFDRLSDTLARAVRTYQDRAARFAAGRIDCAILARDLAAIEDLWMTYDTERRARMASFDADRAARHQALYAAVDSLESRFERSRCRRPGAGG